MTGSSRFGIALILLLVVLLALVAIVWQIGSRDAADSQASGGPREDAGAGVELSATTAVDTSEDGPTTQALTVDETAEESPTAVPPIPEPTEVELTFDASVTQASFYRLSDGHRMATASERYAFPALSLSKLYIAEYVLEHGTEEEIEAALEMVSSSANDSAALLYARYPESINAVAEEYDLYSTVGAEQWGYSYTSTYDVVHFVATLLLEDPSHPILEAMEESDELATDGYAQDFGTAVLPGAIGSKWGWSDDRTVHASVTFGEDWVAAAATAGTAVDLTNYVEAQMMRAVE